MHILELIDAKDVQDLSDPMLLANLIKTVKKTVLKSKAKQNEISDG